MFTALSAWTASMWNCFAAMTCAFSSSEVACSLSSSNRAHSLHRLPWPIDRNGIILLQPSLYLLVKTDFETSAVPPHLGASSSSPIPLPLLLLLTFEAFLSANAGCYIFCSGATAVSAPSIPPPPPPPPPPPSLVFFSAPLASPQRRRRRKEGEEEGKAREAWAQGYLSFSNLQIIGLLIAVGLPEVLQLARVEVSDWHAPFRPNDNA